MFYDWRYIREKRIVIIFMLFILSFFLVFLRLGNIQVFKSTVLAQRAIRQQTREVSLEIKGLGVQNTKTLTRGLFYDRRLESLLDSKEVMRVVIFPQFVDELDETILSLGEVLKDDRNIKSPKDIKRLVKTEPVILPFNLTTSQADRIKALNLSGIAVTKIFARVGSKPLAVNLFGYLEDKDGVNGLEKTYNSALKALASEKSLVANVNVKGEFIPGLGLNVITKVDPNRKHVVTTIDKRVQEIVESVMNTYVEEGAVVVMDVATGDILASASRPTFDPTDMSNLEDQWYKMTKDRAVGFQNSPPGSVFKVLVAAAAIEEGIADENTQFECNDEYFKCSHDDIPHLTLSQALAVSCNNTFVKLALQLGKDKLIDYIRKFNLDTQTIIGYPVESSQFIPLLEEKHTLVNAAIGQDKISLSPVQVTTLLNTIANGGIYRTPRMVQQLIDSSGKEFKRFNLSSGDQIISFETAQMVHRMLTRVTGSDFGTGKQAYVEGYGSAGKTGTAEVINYVNGDKVKKYNSWFSGYAPVQKPKMVITVLIEKPKAKGVKATKVFKEIMTKSLNIEIK